MSNRPKTYKKKLTDGEKLVNLAKERYKRGQEAQNDENKSFDADVQFAYDESAQWPEQIRKQREIDLRPVISVNRMPIFIRSIVNDYRMNTPAIKVMPVDDGADVEVAEIMSGIIRHIEQQSGADSAKENAMTYAVTGGKGFYRIVTDYIDGSFEQDIFIKPVINTRSVTYDCDAHSLDGSDWNWCFIEDSLSEEEFDRRFPNADRDSWSSNSTDWVQQGKIRIAEYFYREMKPVTLCLLSTGEVVREDELQGGMEVIDTREAQEPVVKWCILGGDESEPLEQKDWAGKYIPVVPIFGDQIIIKGKRVLLSLIRYAKDAQRMLNFWRSTETELLALQNKAPYMVTATQIEGYEQDWQLANSANMPYLKYNADPQAGAPMRQGFASPPSGVLQGAANAAQDIMDTTGLQEAGLGMRSNETSGRAIEARSAQGDRASFHFIDNAARADRYCGMILVDLIPKIYDTARVVRTLGIDGSEEMKPINQSVTERDEYGRAIQKIYDIGVGAYDVVVTSGANFNTRRQQASEMLTQIAQGNPQIMQQAGDIIFKVLDMPYADELSERLKKFLPPEISGADEDEGGLPPEIQQQMQQMQAQGDELMQALQQMQAQLEDKSAEMALKEREVAVKEADAITRRIQATQSGKAEKADTVIQGAEVMDEADKVQADIDLKLALKKMELDHAEEMELFRARMKAMENNKDDMVGGYDENMQPVPSAMAQCVSDMQRCMNEMAEKMAALSASQSAPKQVVRDENGRIIGIKPIEAV